MSRNFYWESSETVGSGAEYSRQMVNADTDTGLEVMGAAETRIDFQYIARIGGGPIHRARVRRAGRPILMDGNDTVPAIQPNDINGKFHVLHPEPVTVIVVKNEEHPSVVPETFPALQAALCVLFAGYNLHVHADISGANLDRLRWRLQNIKNDDGCA